MRRWFVLCVVCALACGSPFAAAPVYTPPATPTGKVGLAAEIAAEVEKDPDHAVETLEKRGMTPDQLEDLMAEIAADADMSDAYARARGK